MSIKIWLLLVFALLLIGTGVILIVSDQSPYYGSNKKFENYGKGVIEYSNGDRFEGSFKEGKAEGYGKFTFSNGDVLEGFWEQHRFKGPGRYIRANGTIREITDGNTAR